MKGEEVGKAETMVGKWTEKDLYRQEPDPILKHCQYWSEMSVKFKPDRSLRSKSATRSKSLAHERCVLAGLLCYGLTRTEAQQSMPASIQ